MTTRDERIAAEVAGLFAAFHDDDEWRTALTLRRWRRVGGSDARPAAVVRPKSAPRVRSGLTQYQRITAQVRAIRAAHAAHRSPQPPAICGVYPRRAA